jgi:aryl-alcohol dehydrogenase-like predicted oxidoreductase
MSRLLRISRRKFLAQSTALTAASVLPLSSIAQETMHTRTIPGTTEELPVIGLGAPSVFYKTPPEGPELAKSLVRTMYDMGGRVMDTPAFFRPDPPVLGPILTEMGLQDEMFLAGKIVGRGQDKQAGIDHMETTIANLNKRPMDLMMALNLWGLEHHWPTLSDAKAEGKVRYIGASLTNIRNDPNFDREPIERFMRKERPDFFLLGYSMFQHEAEERLLPLAADLGIAIIVSEAFKTTSDGGYFNDTAGKELPEWASEFDCRSWAQYGLKYIVSHPAVTTVVTETSKVKHVIDNMHGGYGQLPDQAMRKRMSEHFFTLL